MKSRILVVDDNVNLTALLSKALGRFNYDVIVENDSTFAIETVRRFHPDLIILDVMMPHRDGGEVLADLRADAELRHIPVILQTALSREAQSLASTGGIVSPVLTKPVEIRALLMEIEHQIEKRKTTRELARDEVELIEIHDVSAAMPAPRRHAFGALPSGMARSQGCSAFGSSAPRREGIPPLQFKSLQGRLIPRREEDQAGLPR